MLDLFNGRFGRIHHGFLNDYGKLISLLPAASSPGARFTEIAEGDLCWLVDRGRSHLFFKHPSLTNRLPSRARLLDDLHRGNLLTLDKILSPRLKSLRFILELKTGYGDPRVALRKALRLMQRHARGRYWVDAFNPQMLKLVKSLSPHTPTSLHTPIGVYGRYLVRTTYERPRLSLLDLYRLPQVDAVTVTFQPRPSTMVRPLEAAIAQTHRHVFSAGKHLILGGIRNPRTFNRVQQCGAVAAYRSGKRHAQQVAWPAA